MFSKIIVFLRTPGKYILNCWLNNSKYICNNVELSRKRIRVQVHNKIAEKNKEESIFHARTIPVVLDFQKMYGYFWDKEVFTNF